MPEHEIDENDAPEGYLAAAMLSGCLGCAFRDETVCFSPRCRAVSREDGRHVIFIEKEDCDA